MNQGILDEAKQKIDNVIFKFWRSDSVIFGALSLLDKVPNPKYDTMGISVNSGRISLMYNPNFILSISSERLELVLVIESFRCLLRHCTTRLREPGNIAQLASSLSINQLLNDDINKLIEGLDDVTPSPAMFGLKPNEAYEEYYRSLLEKSDDVNQMIQQIWGQMSDEDKEKVIQQAIDGDGSGEGQEGYKEFEDELEAMKAHNNPNGNQGQGWGNNNGFDADIKAFIDKVRHKTKQWGKYTGTAQGQILAAIDPKVSPSDIIRKFGCSVLSGKSVPSRMKINRRFDIEMPGYRRIYQPHVIFAVDSSGSMSDEDLQYGFGIINKLLYYAKITFCEFDTEIKIVEKNIRKARKSFHCFGRGGTDFEAVMNLADKEKVDGLVIYTDGCAPAPHQPKCKVLWLMSQKDQKAPVSWGISVWLNRFDDSKSF